MDRNIYMKYKVVLFKVLRNARVIFLHPLTANQQILYITQEPTG